MPDEDDYHCGALGDEAGSLALFKLVDEQYQPISASEVLPGINLNELLEFIEVRP